MLATNRHANLADEPIMPNGGIFKLLDDITIAALGKTLDKATADLKGLGAGTPEGDSHGLGGSLGSFFSTVTALGAALSYSLSPSDKSNGLAMASPEESVGLVVGPTNRDAAALPANVQDVSLANLGGISPTGPGRGANSRGPSIMV